MPQKKTDPNYALVRGYVPRELHKKFKRYAVEKEMDNSEALETLLRECFEVAPLAVGEEFRQPQTAAK